MHSLGEKRKPLQQQTASAARSARPDRPFRGGPAVDRPLLQLQRTIGNQAVQRLANARTDGHANLARSGSPGPARHISRIPSHAGAGSSIPPKVSAGSPARIYESEAEHTAARVMDMHHLGAYRSPPGENAAAEHARAFDPRYAGSQVNGRHTLPPALQTSMSALLGFDLSGVRVHADAAAARKTSALHARAFTRGPDLFFNRGQYAPETSAGRQLIGHELAHVVQQSRLPAGDDVGLPLQAASLISDREFFLFGNAESRTGFGFSDLVSAVHRRYRLDYDASSKLAHWLNERHRVFYDRRDRRYEREFRVPMPRAVAFFVVDWIEPFDPFASSSGTGSQYRIDSVAFDHAQEIWARENVFVGFRRGRGMTDPGLQQVQFQAATNPDLTPRRNSPSDLNLLAQRPSGALPPGFFHIMVTGSTTESASAAGKSVRSTSHEPVVAASEGIILFAEAYVREGYRQRVGPTSTEPELGELLAHELGHFLFGLSHTDLVFDPTTGGFTAVPRRGIMQEGHTGLVGSEERFSPESRRDIDAAFRTGGVIPRPETPTRR
jgi:hypothetical protein